LVTISDSQRPHRSGSRRAAARAVCSLWGLCAILHLIAAAAQDLWPEEEQRLRVGEKLFAAFLTADQNLAQKLTPSGDVLVLVAHEDADELARKVAARLLLVKRIGGLELRTRVIEADRVSDYRGPRAAAVFLVTPRFGADRLASWGERLGALVFSPFAGDVERGAVAGVYVSDRILPFVNLPQARRAGVRFKPFFLKVAKSYEPRQP
jgi:hypothetical protein